MDQGPLSRRILEEFDALSPQMKAAARFLVDHPDDVALLTMREQARRAHVLPATMTRLAQRLGYDGFDAIREIYVAAIRAGDLGFAGRAGRQIAEQRQKGDSSLAEDHLADVAAAIADLRQPAMLERLGVAADALAAAPRLFCLGLRASFPLAWTTTYLLGLIDDRAVLLDDAGALLADRARAAREGDAALVFGFDPYTRATVETARRLADLGVAVIAITDSPVSPLARLAGHAICVGGGASPAFFRSMTAAFAVAEILAALIAGKRGEAALTALGYTEAHLSASQVHWVDRES
jgi:DNA-binding MurR/RpiR family transcriptional regulator